MSKQVLTKFRQPFNGIKFFFCCCWRYDKYYIILLFLTQILTSVTTIIGLILPKFIIDSLFVQRNYGNAIRLIILQISITSIFMFLNGTIVNKTMCRRMIVFKKFQLYLNKIMMDTDYYHLESNDYLETRNKAYKYLYSDGNGFAQLLEEGIKIIGNTIIIISIIGIIGRLNVVFILILLFITIISIILESYYKKNNIVLTINKATYERSSQYYSNIASDFRYGKEIRTFNISNWILKKYEKILDDMQLIYNKMSDNNIKYSIYSTILNLVQQAVMYSYIIYNVVKNSITVGDFSMYLSSITSFITTIRAIFKNIVDLQQYTIYYNSFIEFLELSKTDNSVLALEKPDLSHGFTIEFKDVSFKYPGHNVLALDNISVIFKSTDKIAIIGENGSGKSTFIKLLLRIYTPTSGSILINDVNINDIDYDYYLSMMSAVYQDYKLYSMSIFDNIILDKEDINVDRFTKVLKECQLDKKIDKLPEKYNTFVYNEFNSNGFEPSGGEGQKIAIARALYRDSRIIILDEPTSALDAKTEIKLYTQLYSSFKEKLVIYISHRMSVARFSDIIISFSSGKVVEYGTHNDLINKEGIYSELYNSQAYLYNDDFILDKNESSAMK